MTMPKDESKEVIQETLTQKIVALTLLGHNEYNIYLALKEQGVSRYMVRKLRNSEEFKALMQEEGERAVATARDTIRSKLTDLEPLAYAALKKNLEDNKMEAVKTWAQMVGAMEKPEQQVEQQGALTIIMPGAPSPQTKDVKAEYEVKDETN